MEEMTNKKLTENGGEALASTLNSIMDFFALGGALRNRSEKDICDLFAKAYKEDRLLALKMLFYTRNIRGGLGERRTFKILANWLATTHSGDMLVNFENIVKFGRCDDFYAFVGTQLEAQAFTYLKSLYDADLAYIKNNEVYKISLVGKWLKSMNTSSKESRKLGCLTAKYFKESPKTYRKNLTTLRKALNIVETKMSSGEWSNIDYEKLPSLAALRYRNAFNEHDGERYSEYLKKLSSGEAKVNTGALYPYDLIKPYCNHYADDKDDSLIESQWKELPNYVTDGKKFLIMADVSGSMYGTPIYVSVSLAMYFAQRNTGIFHNQFMTFSEKPELIQLSDSASLRENTSTVQKANWGMSTNLQAAFKMILDIAKLGHAKQSDLPDALVVITDMEINSGYRANSTFTEAMAKEFEEAGYKMPTLVWWNVNARQNTFHAEFNDERVRFISGCSAAIFKGLCEKMGNTPLELMLGILNDPMYDCIKLAE